jgi:flagellar hook protein FlgE
MRKKVIFLILGFVAAFAFVYCVDSFSAATRESSAKDAQPISLYGNYNGTTTKINVDSNGYVIANFGG